MLHTNCHALHFMLPSDAKIQKNAVFQLQCSVVKGHLNYADKANTYIPVCCGFCSSECP